MMKSVVLICLILPLLVPFCKCIQKSRRLVEKAESYLENLRNTKDSISGIHYHHNRDWSLNEGLLPEEVNLIANRCEDSTLKELYLKALETLEDKNDGDSNCLESDSNINSISPTAAKRDYVLCAEKRNGKYDIASTYITQTGQLDWTKTSPVDGVVYLGSKWVGNRLSETVKLILGSWETVFIFAIVVIVGLVTAKIFKRKARKDYEGIWKVDNAQVLEELKEELRRDYQEMWKVDRAGVLEELKKTLRQDHEEMWKANSVRILKEFKEKLGKDSLWDPSYDKIFEIFKNCCTEHLPVSGRK
ncbi:unnamed protein product [Adineta steineri]|uniref:Uncharacterized protein n=1 Tax=Adineta steineri TaxID=433720 RepID=A0A813XPH1_9BILA|nr:unnamed protein product [Adineta steineri]